MSWLVNVYAEMENSYAAKRLITESPMFYSVEAVGGTQLRISLEVPAADAVDAETACEVAENEVKERVGEHLDRIDNSAATQLEDFNGDEPAGG